MTQGGARARSGPPPDPNAIRRGKDGASDWLHLPGEGRQGEAPDWPLTRASRRELALWRNEWTRPQAVAWEANRQEVEVALYVRVLAEAEKPRAAAASRTLVRQLQEALGLSLPGLARNHWIIDLPASARPEPVAAAEPGEDARARLKVIRRGA
jgi:hypothetical protein